MCADTRGFVPNHPKQTEADFNLDHIIQDIEALRILLKNDHVILVGHSIHSFMALEYARQLPGHVSHLVLVASSPITGPEIYLKADQYFEEFICPERKAAFARKYA